MKLKELKNLIEEYENLGYNDKYDNEITFFNKPVSIKFEIVNLNEDSEYVNLIVENC